MTYWAAGITLLGAIVGFRFRMKVLFSLIAIFLTSTVIIALVKHLPFGAAVWLIVMVQILLQFGYFLGTVGRGVVEARKRSAVLHWSRAPGDVGPSRPDKRANL